MVDEARQAISDCALIDLGFEGYPFTWSNGHPLTLYMRDRLFRVWASKEKNGWTFSNVRV